MVHFDPVNHPGGKSVAKSDRSLAILAGDDEIPVARLDFWHGDLSLIVSIYPSGLRCHGYNRSLDIAGSGKGAGGGEGMMSPMEFTNISPASSRRPTTSRRPTGRIRQRAA